MNLREFSIFASLAEPHLAEVERTLRIRNLERGDVVCRKEDPADGLYLLASGRLQVVEITEDGREVGLNLIQPGAFFGELSVIDDLPRSAHIVAIEPSVMGVLPQAAARELFYRIPSMAEAMMKHLAGKVRAMSNQRVLLGIPSAFQRVFTLLQQMSQAMPGGLVVVQNVPKQQQIAIMLNTSRETVSRAIAELVQAGVVEKDLRRLIVRKPETLQQWAKSAGAKNEPPN